MPRGESIGRIMTLASHAGPPPSAWFGCASRSRMTASPRPALTAKPMALHIVPEGRKSAASLPSSAADISCSLLTVGSSRRCSSPTGAAAIASRIAGVGRVEVSLVRSIMTMAPPGARRPAAGQRTS